MTKLCSAGIFLAMTLALAPGGAAQTSAAKSGTQAGADSAKEDDIRQLFTAMGVNKLGEQIWEQLNERMTKSNPQIPDSVWQEIDKEFRSEFSSGKFGEILIPIYRKYFSGDEIKQMIQFYQSPVGKKFVDVAPQLVGEAMAAGEDRGKEIVKRIQEKLKQKGYSIQAE